MNVRKNGIVVARKTNNGLKANTSTTTSTGQLIRVNITVYRAKCQMRALRMS